MTTNIQQKNKIFFPNLDGLRFVCFLLVFFYHVNESLADKISNPTVRGCLNFLFKNANVGVNIFFVLSGFLITFLLIKEKEFKNNINLKNFYIRRILRIWPLFYLCVFVGFVLFPAIKFNAIRSPYELSNSITYLFFLNNFDLINIWPNVPDALSLIVLWSVAVEEQFYLVWPIVLKFMPNKKLVFSFSIIIIATLIFRGFYNSSTNADYAYRYFHTLSVIGDMALGGIVAYYCSFKSKFLAVITNLKKWQTILLYLVTFLVVLFKEQIFIYSVPIVFERLFLAILFALIIAEQNYSTGSFYKFSMFKQLSKLGMYTYGLYCLHFIGIILAQRIIFKFHFFSQNNLFAVFSTIFLALFLTIFSSIISYHLFEKRFLKLKDKFAFIVKK
jgi:peptidoglycan/LPS O-acetylase OafA/YrhL